MISQTLKTACLGAALAFCAMDVQAQDATSGEVALFLTIETQAGQRDALVTLWEAHLRSRAAEDAAHISYVFALDMNDPDVVHITEVYATQAAFQDNSQSDWFAAYMAEAGPLLAGEPGFAMATPYWVK